MSWFLFSKPEMVEGDVVELGGHGRGDDGDALSDYNIHDPLRRFRLTLNPSASSAFPSFTSVVLGALPPLCAQAHHLHPERLVLRDASLRPFPRARRRCLLTLNYIHNRQNAIGKCGVPQTFERGFRDDVEPARGRSPGPAPWSSSFLLPPGPVLQLGHGIGDEPAVREQDVVVIHRIRSGSRRLRIGI